MAIPVDELDDLVSLERGEVDRRIYSDPGDLRAGDGADLRLLARNLSNFF
jgi:hypothetical protein